MFSPEILTGSVVVLGAFAPAMFTADWLHYNKLIGGVDFEEMQKSEKTLVAQNVSHLECGLFTMQVTDDRIQVLSKDVLRPTINDLMLGILTLIGEAPIRSVGVNFFGHYKMATEDSYHSFGDVLAPKNIWTQIFSNPDWSVGLSDMTMKISFQPRSSKERDPSGISVRVQPSAKLPNGILLSYNNHLEIFEKENSTEQAAEFLRDHWQSSWDDAMLTFSKLLSVTVKQA